MDDLERRFNGAMVSIYETAKRELGYNATRFVQMISEQGGRAPASVIGSSSTLLSCRRVSQTWAEVNANGGSRI